MKILILTLAMLVTFNFSASGQGTVFTYQGRLTENTLAANGTFQMQFALYDAAEAGSQIGTDIDHSNVSVTNGTFTVQLDFGSAFSGPARFLEIRVRKTAGDAYITLTPRQMITSSPHAIRSISSGSADSMSSACVLCITDAHIESIAGNKVTGSVPNADAAATAAAVTGVVPIANGGTGSSTKNFVDLSNDQTVGGNKTFSGNVSVSGSGVLSGNGSGLTNLNSSVVANAPLTGNGTSGSPLGIASPLTVKDSDNPARNPFAASVNNSGIVFTNVNGSGITLVIESMSGFVAVSAASGGLNIGVTIGNDTFGRTFQIGPSLIYNIPNSNPVAFYNHQLRLYVPQGQRLELTLPSGLNRDIQLSGYYVSIP
jgi:hypothetical protein